MNSLRTYPLSGGALNKLFRTFTLAFAVALSLSPIAVDAQTAAELSAELTRQFRLQYSSDAQLDAANNKTYGVTLPPDKAKVARGILRRLLDSPELPDYVTKLVLPLYSPDMTKEQLASAMGEGIGQMQVKGMLRLPPDRQAVYVQYIVAMSEGIAPNDCKAMYFGRLDGATAARLERRFIANLPLQSFMTIANLYSDAVQAELVNYPVPRTLNQSQAKVAEKVYQAAVAKRLQAPELRAAQQSVASKGESADPGEVCALLVAGAAAMLDLTDPYRSWQLTKFMESIQ